MWYKYYYHERENNCNYSTFNLVSANPLGQEQILPVPSTQPSPAQQKQIARKYGMFIHFGINTFHDQEWTDGSKPASSYQPTAVDADQWIRVAKEAGMKYDPYGETP